MDNRSIARVLKEIADLLEIKDDNPFKIRAYRAAAETVGDEPDPIDAMTPQARLALPGIGKDLAAKIGELIQTGSIAYHQQLLQAFPSTLLDVLRLSGIGPKTVARLYREIGVSSLDDLERAAHDGRLRRMSGMGLRKEAQILKALEQRRRQQNGGLFSNVDDIAAALDAELAGAGPPLVTVADLRGDVHCHTTATDGRDTIEAMARAAQAAGLEYLAVTDHSQSLAMANGLDERGVDAHVRAIREVGARLDGFTLLAGIECDIRADGTMDLADDCLAGLDIVNASIHSGFSQDPARMTDRLLRAIACPWVDVLAHPLGRRLFKREGHQGDMDVVFAAAATAGVAMEINAQIERLDLDETHAGRAHAAGVAITISSDAHSTLALGGLRWGVAVGRRAGLAPVDVINTRSVQEFRASLRRQRN
ncbi:MAG TPA: helix-hairpin-helix domain-containing protein [Vicinamibacterales bacterium]